MTHLQWRASDVSLSSALLNILPWEEFVDAVDLLVGDTARQVTSSEVKDLRREAGDLKEALAETLYPVIAFETD